MDNKAVEIAVAKPWSGRSFSKRIWINNDKLAKELQQVLGIGLGQGYSIERMARDLDFRMKKGYKNAQRIVRTETNFVMSEANAEAYKASGVKRYQFVAVLDYKTSEICQGLDGKVFDIKERKVGVNCNPMHPNCRSTTAPYTGRKIPTRIARGADGKTYFVDGDVNYKEWYENLAQTEKDKMKLLRTMDKNKSTDLKQFEKYKEVLSTRANSFENFQKIKYNSVKEWEELKKDYRVNRAIEKNLRIIDNDKERAHELYFRFKDKDLYVSDHFVEQYIHREFDGHGNQVFAFDEIVEIAKREPTHTDTNNGRNIVFDKDTRISIVFEEDKLITIRKGKESKSWQKL